jgi:hypothetical protein
MMGAHVRRQPRVIDLSQDLAAFSTGVVCRRLTRSLPTVQAWPAAEWKGFGDGRLGKHLGASAAAVCVGRRSPFMMIASLSTGFIGTCSQTTPQSSCPVR